VDREHIAEYADSRFVVATGGSAAGTRLGSSRSPRTIRVPARLEAVDTSVRGCVPFYGVYDFTNRHNFQRHAACAAC